MEAWAALGIATNILTVAEAGLELIKKGSEVYNSVSGATAENEVLQRHERHLKDAATELLNKLKQSPGRSSPMSQDDIALNNTAQRCVSAAQELDILLTSLQRHNQSSSTSHLVKRFGALRVSAKSMWKKDKIQTLEKILRDSHTLVQTRLLISIHQRIDRAHPPPVPEPRSNVPFRRDKNFVGQEGALQDLQHVFAKSDQHNRAALYGLGGVGKSQIAIEFSYRYREQSPGNWVFWVYSGDPTRFELSFKDIASCVEIPRRNDPDCDLFQLVFEWLSEEKNGKWLIILDNADNADTFFGTNTGNESGLGKIPLASYLPQTTNGQILVTSRYKHLASDLVLGDETTIEVKEMDESTALTLFKTRIAVDPAENWKCIELLRALDLLPLAIIHAASYIKSLGSRITIARYLQLLKEDEKDDLVLETLHKDPRRHQDFPVSVFSTWKISFEQIRSQAPLAAELFSRMSVLNRQAIPQFLFYDGDFDRSFEEALVVLLDFSLLTTDLDKKNCSMHRLVQSASKKWLDAKGELRRVEDWSIATMARTFPKGRHENRERCQVLLPHVDIVLSYVASQERELQLQRCDIQSNLAWYYETSGKYSASEVMNRRALEGREQELGPSHPDTLTSVSNLALVLQDQGKYEASEALNRRALEGREQELGPLHPDTLTSVSNLASVLRYQGKYEASEAINRRALEGYEQELGPLHPDTLTSVSNLAGVLRYQGKYEASEALNRRALEGREQELGPLHPDTLTSVSNLALVLQDQGKYEASEALNRRALEGCEQELGPLHPDTLTSVSNLAGVLRYQGKYEASEALNRRALEDREQELGPLHPDTLTSVSNLALVLQDQGKYEASEALNRRALEGSEQELGPLHPDTLTSVSNLAGVLRYQGKYEASEALNRRALEGREQELGPLHPDTLTSVSNLALVLQDQGKYEASEALNRRALEGCEQELGPLYPDTLTSVSNLAGVLRYQGKYEASEALNRRALEGREQELGPLHPDTLTSVSNLALVLQDQGKYEASEALNRRALEGREQELGPLHPDTLTSVSNLALVLQYQGKYEAHALFQRARAGFTKALGADHPTTMECMKQATEALAVDHS